MATLDDVRAIVRDLPGLTETGVRGAGTAGWRTTRGLVVWERGPSKADLRRLAEEGASWPDGVVLGLAVDGLEAKDELIAAFDEICFTIAHFDGYPAVLLRLDATPYDQLRELVTDAWLTKAPPKLRQEWLADNGLE
ncbi:MAG TPA: hypothetical protein IAA98_02630 [Candidatus Avipropionibacterium avicola]|uniref:MmcQ/YjbR family DNA-binding protein n=1 Tax=Candidatus Avipropionibacterium avicola TaxID=2840701 RepID=A0A9D1KLB1_9ACTN|nr:hypothetical protein [Candidatus Avipropionibacterium avicola]